MMLLWQVQLMYVQKFQIIYFLFLKWKEVNTASGTNFHMTPYARMTKYCTQMLHLDFICFLVWLPICLLSSNQDRRLRTGDHILRIGTTPTTGLTSDQVVKVLQGCGSRVTMLIARDPQGQRSTAPPPPPPPDSAPVASLPPRTSDLPARPISKTVS